MSGRFAQRGAVLMGCAGGMLVVGAALASGYYIVSTRSEARAANAAPAPAEPKAAPATHDAKPPQALRDFLAKPIEVKTGSAVTKLAWSELGIEIDPDEVGRAS